jgi:hypothetical protein
MLHGEMCSFGPPEPTTKQKGENCVIALTARGLQVWGSNQLLRLFRAEPIAQTDSESLRSFDSQNTCCQVWA